MCRKKESGQECVPLLQANLLPHHYHFLLHSAGDSLNPHIRELIPFLPLDLPVFVCQQLDMMYKYHNIPDIGHEQASMFWEQWVSDCMCLYVIQTPKHSNPEVHNDNLQSPSQVGVSGNFAVITVRFLAHVFTGVEGD